MLLYTTVKILEILPSTTIEMFVPLILLLLMTSYSGKTEDAVHLVVIMQIWCVVLTGARMVPAHSYTLL